MSVRRPQWVQRLAFVLFELTDPAGAARLRMSRGALNEAGDGPSGRRAGLGNPASLSALREGAGLYPSEKAPGERRPAASLEPATAPSLSASADVVSLPGASSPLLEARPRTFPGLGGRAQLLLFAAIFFGPALGWALGVIFGVTL